MVGSGMAPVTTPGAGMLVATVGGGMATVTGAGMLLSEPGDAEAVGTMTPGRPTGRVGMAVPPS